MVKLPSNMVKLPSKTPNGNNSQIMALSSAEAKPISKLHGELFARGWDMNECLSMITQPTVFGFYARFLDNDTPLGFCLARVSVDEAEILSIGTRKKMQHHGLGWRLLSASIGEAQNRGATRLFLEVDENNAPALALYHKLGFAMVGLRKSYYDNGDAPRSNALVLERKLN